MSHKCQLLRCYSVIGPHKCNKAYIFNLLLCFVFFRHSSLFYKLVTMSYFKHLRNIAKGDYQIRQICPSVYKEKFGSHSTYFNEI